MFLPSIRNVYNAFLMHVKRKEMIFKAKNYIINSTVTGTGACVFDDR